MSIHKHGAAVGMTVLYTRPGERGAESATYPAIVTRAETYGAVTLCAFTPAPAPVWGADYDADGKPGTWRHLDAAPR